MLIDCHGHGSLKGRYKFRAMLIGIVVLALALIPQTRSQDQAAAPPAAALDQGIVVDEAGKPVAGAAVMAVRFDAHADVRNASADGHFPLKPDDFTAHGCIAFLAEADGGARQGLLGLFDLGITWYSARPRPVRIVLKPCRTVAVSVKDGAGKPAAGAGVEVIANYVGLLSAQTDADGKAVLRIPQDARVDWIIALKPGLGFDYFENYKNPQTSERPALPAEVALVLDGAKKVSVKAEDTGGKAVAGVAFVPLALQKPGKMSDANLTGSVLARVQTDAQGLAMFGWVPVNAARRSTPMLVRGPEYFCPEPPQFLTVVPGDVTLTARLLRNVRIGGKVQFPDGKPAADIRIQVAGEGNTTLTCHRFATTGPDGVWSAVVYPDQGYIIAVCDENWAAKSYSGLVIREGPPREDLDFLLGKGTLLHGIATAGKENRPIPGENVMLVQRGPVLPANLGAGMRRPNLMRWTKTNAEGRYTLRVGPGEYALTIGSDSKHPLTLTVKDEPEINRDYHTE